MTPPALSIVVPAYNEAGRIGATVTTLAGSLSRQAVPWEIRVVDDGSTDDTVAVVESAASGDARIVVQREPHRGKGGTVKAGMLGTRASLRFMCDADLSMPAHELDRFLELVPSRFDVVIGSREGAGARRVNEPAYRHHMGRLFNTLVRATVLSGFNDTQCGFKMFTGEAADRIFPRVRLDGWAFDIEVLVIAQQHALRVHEMPIEWHYRPQSQLSPLRDSIRMAQDVLRIRTNVVRNRYR